jgi:hypothetical protein
MTNSHLRGLPEDDVEIRVLERGLAMRAPEAAGGVAAAVTQWLTAADGSPAARVRLCDGSLYGWVVVSIVPGVPVPEGPVVEMDLEELAVKLGRGDRLSKLIAAQPIRWCAPGRIEHTAGGDGPHSNGGYD